MAEQAAEPMMDVKQVAEYMNVRESWVYDNWRTEGIPFARLGGQLRCSPADLREWIASKQAA